MKAIFTFYMPSLFLAKIYHIVISISLNMYVINENSKSISCPQHHFMLYVAESTKLCKVSVTVIHLRIAYLAHMAVSPVSSI